MVDNEENTIEDKDVDIIRPQYAFHSLIKTQSVLYFPTFIQHTVTWTTSELSNCTFNEFNSADCIKFVVLKLITQA